MKILNQLCSNCGGTGIAINYVLETNFGEYGIAQRTERRCECCDGKGYTGYAMFDLEEAAQIMKVCGLERTEEHD